MANQWVYLARLTFSAVVCSGVMATSLPVVAWAQTPTEGAPANPPAMDPAAPAPTGDGQVSATTAGETIGEAVSTSTDAWSNAVSTSAISTDAVPSNPAEVSAPVIAQPVVAPQPVPVPQSEAPIASGGFVQRLAETLNAPNAVRVAPPVPAANRDPRADLLDTSFPAEQPEAAEPDPDFGANPNSRPTQARTANGVTELSNRSDLAMADAVPVVNRTATPKPPLSRPQVNTEVSNPRLESQVSLRTTSVSRTSSTSPWLWVLAGTAALLLVPIAFLLTRPTR